MFHFFGIATTDLSDVGDGCGLGGSEAGTGGECRLSVAPFDRVQALVDPTLGCACRFLVEDCFKFLFHDQCATATEHSFTVGFAAIGADRRIGHDADVVFVFGIVLTGKFKRHVNVIINVTIVGLLIR